MKKHVLSILALSLCAFLLFCTVGCNQSPAPTEYPDATVTEKPTNPPTPEPTETNENNGNDENNENNNENNENSENNNENTENNNENIENEPSNGGSTEIKTEEQLFEQMKAAFEAMQAYDGAFSIYVSRSGDETNNEGTGEQYTSVDKIVYETSMTADKASEKYIVIDSESYYENDVFCRSAVYTDKYFTEGGKHYLLQTSTYEYPDEEAQESIKYVLYPERSWSSTFATLSLGNVINDSFGEAFGIPFNESSYAELCEAYKEVFDELSANEKKSAEAAGAQEETPLTATYSITFGEENGVLSMTVSTYYTVAYSTDGNIEMQTVKNESVLYASEGKITGFENTSYLSEGARSTDENYDWICNSKAEYTLEYTFDADLYDGVQTQLPAEEDIQTRSEYINKNTTVIVNGEASIDVNVYIALAETVDFGAELRSGLENGLSLYSDQGYTFSWYTDEAHSALLDFSSIDSAEDIEALSTVYLHIKADDQHAVRINSFSVSNDYSDDFVTVFGEMSNDFWSNTSCSCYEKANINRFEIDYPSSSSSRSITVSVNGTVINESDYILTLWGDKVYYVEYEGGEIFFVHKHYEYNSTRFDFSDLFFDF